MAEPRTKCATIPRECADRFEAGTKAMTIAAGEIRTVKTKVDAMHKTLLGNGDPEKSVVFRLQLLENRAHGRDGARSRSISRLWGIVAAVISGGIMLLLGILAKSHL